MEETYVITGGSGWVGKNFLFELYKFLSYEEFKKNLFVFGSKDRIIKLRDSKNKKTINIPVKKLSLINEVLKEKEKINLVHTAFLTREKVNKFGIKKYIKTNTDITNHVVDFLKIKKESKAVIISSGAATIFEQKNKSQRIIEKDPYGFLKLEEEKKISKIVPSLTLRIYGLTGKFIRDPNLFALGNFLIDAKNKNHLKIISKYHVIRSYGCASDIAKLGIKWLSREAKTELLYAATDTISIYELAIKITNLYNLNPIESDIDENLSKDDYSCETYVFKNYLKTSGIKITNLEKQIQETFEYI